MLLPGLLSAGKPVTELLISVALDPPPAVLQARKAFVLLDAEARKSAKGNALLAALEQQEKGLVHVVSGGEGVKTRRQAEDVALSLPDDVDHMIVCGGGATLNLGTFVAGQAPSRPALTLVPTTTMAMADVAVGGLGMLNDDEGKKNSIRVRRDPDRILIFPDFLVDAPAGVIRGGIIEGVKHAMLQSPSDGRRLLALYLDNPPNVDACFHAALETLRLKAELLGRLDRDSEDAIERLFSYGHLHAHVIETCSQWRRPHDQCVVIGILMDLLLTEDVEFEPALRMVLGSAAAACLSPMLAPKLIDMYLAAYPDGGQVHIDKFRR